MEFNRKILTSLLIIGLVGAVVGGSTLAVFNDTETSEDNVFAAGALDLKIDWNETRNGEVIETQSFTDNPGPIFEFSDVKPGDEGEATVSLHLFDNPGFVWMTLEQTANQDNSCTEPEAVAEGGDCGTEGELGDHLNLHVWYDDGDNVHEEGEETFFNGTAEELSQEDINDLRLDGNPDTEEIDPFVNSTTYYVGIKWSVPLDTGNEIQTDSKRFNLSFRAEQARHQDGNVTPPTPEPTEENVTNVTTIRVMKHICDKSIQNVSQFNSVDGPDTNNDTQFHDKVLACPTVVREDDDYNNGTVQFSEKRDFDFTVEGAEGEEQTIDDASFVQEQLTESAIDTDVNGDGDKNDSLETSHYVYENVTAGTVTVTETMTPGNTRPGALEFTPDAIMDNDDASTLDESMDGVLDDAVIELNTSKDSQDDLVTLHVYNFQNVTEPEPQEENETIYWQAELVGGEPIQNLSHQLYSNRPFMGNDSSMIRFIHGLHNGTTGDQLITNQQDPMDVWCVTDTTDFELDGDTAQLNFTVRNNSMCDTGTNLSIVSYAKDHPGFDASKAGEQILFDNKTNNFEPGTHTWSVDLPTSTDALLP